MFDFLGEEKGELREGTVGEELRFDCLLGDLNEGKGMNRDGGRVVDCGAGDEGNKGCRTS